MPDRWGRPTMADGLQLAQAIKWIRDIKDTDQQRERDTQRQDRADTREEARFLMAEDEYRTNKGLIAENRERQKMMDTRAMEQQDWQRQRVEKADRRGDVQFEQQQMERQIEQEAYAAAEAVARGADTSSFSPESRYKGAQLAYQSKLNEIKSKNAEMLNSQQGMQEVSQRLDLNLKKAAGKLQQYKAARAAKDDETAKKIAIELNNEHMYTGRFVDSDEDGYVVKNQDGQTIRGKDLPIEEVDQIIGAYFDRPVEEIMQWQFGAEEFRRKKNEEILSQAEPYVNEKTGQIIYRVPPGAWGPDGKPRDAFYADSQGNEVPKGQAKGFNRMKDVLDIEKTKQGGLRAAAQYGREQRQVAKAQGGQPPQIPRLLPGTTVPPEDDVRNAVDPLGIRNEDDLRRARQPVAPSTTYSSHGGLRPY